MCPIDLDLFLLINSDDILSSDSLSSRILHILTEILQSLRVPASEYNIKRKSC